MTAPRPLPELVDYRKAKGLTRRALANKLQVTETTIWRWETGERRPDRRFALRVSKMTGVPLDILMGVA